MFLEEFESQYSSEKEELLKNYCEFLSIPSVSAHPCRIEQCIQAKLWVERWLIACGFSVETVETGGAPLLLAQRCSSAHEATTLLFYTHYDVQPEDPVELWASDPFKGEIRDGKIYARGAQDNKGQLFSLLAALKLFFKRGGDLPFHCKICCDGQEEIGSPGLESLLEQRMKSEEAADPFFSADYTLILDLVMKNEFTPAITMGTRGLITYELILKEGISDKHSGLYGGLAYNPLRALVELLAGLRDSKGVVVIPEFYQDIIKPTSQELALYDLKIDEEAYYLDNGIYPSREVEACFLSLGGLGYLNSCWPTLEINGITGGYGGEGFKTVIPFQAIAKLSCRVVPGQNPALITLALERFFQNNLPEGLSMEFRCLSQAKAWRGKLENHCLQHLSQAVRSVWGKEPAYILEGATIPIAHLLEVATGSQLVMFGYGLRSDLIHAPNEHFSLERLKIGVVTLLMLFSQWPKGMEPHSEPPYRGDH
jgi:acetylornithine deacetylase/succinyl-diaminopimelate desuccinylase-like protein